MADNYSNPEVEIVYVELKDYETSGIDHVSTSKDQESNAMYNLAGQSVGASYKGIVIVNGKKYLKR